LESANLADELTDSKLSAHKSLSLQHSDARKSVTQARRQLVKAIGKSALLGAGAEKISDFRF
jgi:hypothetical protein